MSRPARRAVRRFARAACLTSLIVAVGACVTGQNSSHAPNPVGFGVTAAELRGSQPLDRFAQTVAGLDTQQKTPASGREAAPLQVAGAMVVTEGVGSFTRFRSDFLNAVAVDRRQDYLDHILFPLTLLDYRRPDSSGQTIRASRFAPHLVYDELTLAGRDVAPVPLGDTFTGAGSEALYWGDRLLVFRPVEGRWMLTEAGSCDDASCKPAHLLCRGFDTRRAFPGRTPHGYEDFGAFYRAFYCMSDGLLGESEAVPGNVSITSRIRFPLMDIIEEPDPALDGEVAAEPIAETMAETDIEVVEPIDIDTFQPAMLFPSRRAVPQISVDGTEARVIVGVDDNHTVTAAFTRFEGLWHLTGLSM